MTAMPFADDDPAGERTLRREGSKLQDIPRSEQMDEEIEVPVNFRYSGEIYSGNAQFRANWHHIKLTGRLIRTGGWDYALASKELGDDKFAITAEQFEDLKAGRSIQVDFGDGIPVTVEPGEYSPPTTDSSQGQLFGE